MKKQIESDTPEVSRDRFLKRLHRLGNVGAEEKGICREAFTPSYFKGVETLKEFMEAEGLEVRVDPVGNVYGRFEGANPQAAPVLVGSHLDTVRNGGLYDGNLGVVAALECVAAMRERKILPHCPIEVVAFNGEEGGLLGGTFGSRTAAGRQSLEIDGVDEKLGAYNLKREDVLGSKLPYVPKAYLELHIEQGMKLFNESLQIGIAEGIVGITRYKITVQGMANHAGTTPMAFRRDALVAASSLIVTINRLANQQEEPFVATVGKIEVKPNSVNVIPGQAELILELREMKLERIHSFIEQIKEAAEAMEGYDISFELYSHKESVELDRSLASLVEDTCGEKSLSCKRMYSGAGHDAMELAQITEAALIFIPSKDGISHSIEEYSTEEDLVTGTQLLLDVLTKLCE